MCEVLLVFCFGLYGWMVDKAYTKFWWIGVSFRIEVGTSMNVARTYFALLDSLLNCTLLHFRARPSSYHQQFSPLWSYETISLIDIKTHFWNDDCDLVGLLNFIPHILCYIWYINKNNIVEGIVINSTLYFTFIYLFISSNVLNYQDNFTQSFY